MKIKEHRISENIANTDVIITEILTMVRTELIVNVDNNGDGYNTLNNIE